MALKGQIDAYQLAEIRFIVHDQDSRHLPLTVQAALAAVGRD
jgi:hypothetical protein